MGFSTRLHFLPSFVDGGNGPSTFHRDQLIEPTKCGELRRWFENQPGIKNIAKKE
jgi:hypothetical protein